MFITLESPGQDAVVIKIEPCDGDLDLDPMEDPLALDLPIPANNTVEKPEGHIEYVMADHLKGTSEYNSIKSEPSDPLFDPYVDNPMSTMAATVTAENDEEQDHGYEYIADVDIDYDLKPFPHEVINHDLIPGISTDIPKPIVEKKIDKVKSEIIEFGLKLFPFEDEVSQQVAMLTPGRIPEELLNSKSNAKKNNQKSRIRSEFILPGNGDFECETCHKFFKTKNYLQAHMTTHSNERNHVCSVCGTGFKRSTQLKDHMMRHTAEKCCQCPWFDVKYSTLSRLKAHVTKFHSGNQIEIQKSEEPSNASEDKYLKILPKPNKAKVLASCTKSKFQCDICQKFTKTKNTLRVHKRLIHSEVGAFVCDICPKSFKNQRYLQHHKLVTHSEERNHLCSVCGKKFKRSSSLTCHMFYHTKEQASKCPYCDDDKKFVTKHTLTQHIKRCHLVIDNAQTESDNKSGISEGDDDDMARSESCTDADPLLDSVGLGLDPLIVEITVDMDKKYVL